MHIKIGLLVTFSHALPARVDIKEPGNDVVRGTGEIRFFILWKGAHLVKMWYMLILYAEFL